MNTPSEIERILGENKRMREALKFYANKETYGSDDKSHSTGNECFDVVCFDFSINLEPGKDFAGRNAREVLATLDAGERMRITFDIEISNSLPSDVLARVHYPHDVPPNKIIINKGLNAIELSEAIHHEIGHIFDWYLGQSSRVEIREQNAEIIGEAIRFRESGGGTGLNFGNQAKNKGEL